MKISSIKNTPLEFAKTKNSKNNQNFEDIMKNFIADVNSDLKVAKDSENLLMSGKANNIQEIMANIEKASISFTFLTEIRNKALESYQEIMRMQV